MPGKTSAAARVLACVTLAAYWGSGAWAAEADARAVEHFESKVRPVLVRSCSACHGPAQQQAGLRLDSRAHALAGGKSGPAIAPGDPRASPLVRAVRGETLRMPLGGRLTDEEIAAIERWVADGAPWPAAAPSAASPPAGNELYDRLVAEHWAFRPVGHPAPPEVRSSRWAARPIDRFVGAKLEEKGLISAKPAARETLARRLSYALTGLPPTAAEMAAFAADPAPDAYQRLVDRLLASPRFGEHWARRWLDVARFAETRGYEWNFEILGAWRYRDYVVRAFNADLPYDRFVREHISGDLLPDPRIDAATGVNESVIATAFHRLGEAGHDDCTMFREIALDVADNQIDTVGKAFQGLTVACARCHDHKLDPIPAVDYYGLYSVLNSSRNVTRTIDAPEVHGPGLRRLAGLKTEIRTEISRVWASDTAAIAGRLAERRARFATPDGAEPVPLEDPAHPLHRLAGASEAEFAAVFAELAEIYRRENAERAAHNASGFRPFGDFRDGLPAGWSADGVGLRAGASAAGDFAVETEGERAIRGVFPAGLYSHGLSARMNGAVRSPALPAGAGAVSLRVMGGSLGARRTIVDNCAIGEDYAFVESRRPAWVTVEANPKWGDLPVFVELVTRRDNPRFPDRPGKVKEKYLPLFDRPDSHFGIVEAVVHGEAGAPPKEPLDHLLALFEGPPARDWEDLAARYRRAAEGAVERWGGGRATAADALWLDWLLEHDLLDNRAGMSPRLRSLIDEYRRVEAELPEPRVVEGLEEFGDGRDFPVLLSGNPHVPGEIAPRRFLGRLYGQEPLTRHGSGRRELAQLLVDERNPLTARVMVNRVWHWLFGRGLVATVDNFGALGEAPSHPELLDYLARRFMDNGWSVKSLVREIVLSEAFRLSGAADAAALEADPQNAFLHHFPARRLSAEELRDSLLAAAGELDDRLYGPSVDPYRKQPKEYRRLFSGPLLGDGRRSLYLKVTRMEGAGFLETFDFPYPGSTRGARDATTVPAQSLALLNDPFVLETARLAAQKAMARAGTAPEARVAELFRAILAREPSDEEIARFVRHAERLAGLRGDSQVAAGQAPDVWADLAHILVNTKEFSYVE